jgi:hypothetical protein
MPAGETFSWLGTQNRHSAADILNMGVRSYAPGIGRFLQADPVLDGSSVPREGRAEACCDSVLQRYALEAVDQRLDRGLRAQLFGTQPDRVAYRVSRKAIGNQLHRGLEALCSANHYQQVWCRLVDKRKYDKINPLYLQP